jgi:hypothetical protein
MKENYSIHILNTGRIKVSKNGAEYRHLIFEDINNHKTVDYIIFKNKHQFLWNEVLNKYSPETIYPGKILNLEITNEFLKYIRFRLPLTIKRGDFVDIIVWYWDSWNLLTEGIRIIRSFEDQIWRFRNFSKNQ